MAFWYPLNDDIRNAIPHMAIPGHAIPRGTLPAFWSAPAQCEEYEEAIVGDELLFAWDDPLIGYDDANYEWGP